MLLVGGAFKLIDPSGTVGALRALGLSFGPQVVRVAAAIELFLGVLALSVSNPIVAGFVALSYALFVVIVVLALAGMLADNGFGFEPLSNGQALCACCSEGTVTQERVVLSGDQRCLIAAPLDRAEATRWRNAGFWGVFALLLGVGPWLPDLANGCLVLVMVGLATWGLHPVPPAPSSAEAQGVQASRLGNWLFVPALAIPLVTLAGTLSVGDGRIAGFAVIDPKQVTLVALTIGAVVALVLAMRLTRPPRSAPAAEARRLVDAIGWAIVLPQMLAALGGETGVGAATLFGQSLGVAGLLALAGWLLVLRASSVTERRVFATATLLLVGGAADFLAFSPLLTGLTAGVLWQRLGVQPQ